MDAENRSFYLALVGFIVVLAICFPLARALDHHEDQPRGVYLDLERMAELEYQTGIAQGEGEAVTVGPGETVQIGSRHFTSSPDVTVSVTLIDRGYCVATENARGDAEAHCWRYTKDPAHSDGFPPSKVP